MGNTSSTWHDEDILRQRALGYAHQPVFEAFSSDHEPSTVDVVLPQPSFGRVPLVTVIRPAAQRSIATYYFQSVRFREPFAREVREVAWRRERGRNTQPKAGQTGTLPIRDPELPLSERIDRFRTIPGSRLGDRVATRLKALLEVSREEAPEQAPPAGGSLHDFFSFLLRHPGLAYPSIGLTPGGNVWVEWRRGPGEFVALQFLGEGDVQFVVFTSDPTHSHKKVRVSGKATVDSVLAMVRGLGVDLESNVRVPEVSEG